MRTVSNVSARAALVLALLPLSNRAHAQFDFLKKIDPTNKNSDLREGLKRIDPTNKHSSTREGLRQIDPTNKNSAVREGLRRIDPSVEAHRRFEEARANALRGLRKLDPNEIFARVQAAINQQIHNELNRNSAAWNERTGDLDLRNTGMGRSLESWLGAFAQGNKSYGRVDEFTFSTRTRRLEVRLTARHCHSWGRIIPGQPPVDLYSITQHASFRYDFRNHSGSFKIDAGRLAPPLDTKTFERMSEGDLVAVAESLSPRVVGDLVNYERVNQYDQVCRRLQSRYGAENVYIASKSFVDWASPDTLGRYAITGVLTAGASVYPQFMRDAQRQAARELPGLIAWLNRRGMGNAAGVARDLLSGQQPRWPFLKFEVVPVRYSAREKPLHAFATPWRHIDHLAFIVVWNDRARTGPDPREVAAAGRLVGRMPADVRKQPLGPDLHARPGTGAANSVDQRTALRPRSLQFPGPGSAGETYAANLGISYEPVQYGDGTFGIKVTRPPAANSPTARLGLEPGDIIFALDGQRFRRPSDVLAHRFQTSLNFINVRTNAPQSANIYIP